MKLKILVTADIPDDEIIGIKEQISAICDVIRVDIEPIGMTCGECRYCDTACKGYVKPESPVIRCNKFKRRI